MLYDLKEQRLATAAYSDPTTGEFLVCLPTERAYALNAGAEGYLFFSRNYDITGSGTAIRPYVLNIPMSPLRSGGSISLRNVFFASASAELLPESHLELDKVVRLLFVNPTVRLEVAGHTDDVGGEQDNLDLSQRRAAAVRDYLIAKGVAADRLEARDYGETKPIAPNDSEEGRAQNRRTEVKVL